MYLSGEQRDKGIGELTANQFAKKRRPSGVLECRLIHQIGGIPGLTTKAVQIYKPTRWTNLNEVGMQVDLREMDRGYLDRMLSRYHTISVSTVVGAVRFLNENYPEMSIPSGLLDS